MPLVNTEFSTTIPKNIKNADILDYVCQRFSYRSREDWIKKIAQQELLLNGQPCTLPGKVQGGDTLCYLIRDYLEPDVPMDVEVIYQNEMFSLLGKKASIPIHRSSRILVNTFTNLAAQKCNHEKMTPFHRLDAETSGLILYANHPSIASKYQKNLSKILQRKFYLCIVEGIFETPKETTLFLGEKKDSPIRSQMHALPMGDGKESTTHFFPLGTHNNQSLVLAEILTGRKHQIRATLAHLGHPIVSDKIYNHGGMFYLKRLAAPLSDEDLTFLGTPTQLLHSFAAQIQLPGEEPTLFQSHSFTDGFLEHLKNYPQAIQRAKATITALCQPTPWHKGS